jgi:phycocyanobilin:ferredoxin oxidoreductase
MSQSSVIWDKLIECKNEIINIFDANGTEYDEPGLAHFNNELWINRVWQNEHIRRAHIDVVDARDTKGLWMMHVCVFPVLTNDGPIYGFDVIAGKKKMTGAFHDFSRSSGGNNHPMIEGYREAVADFIPSKRRELPEWAQNIFTDSMIAAGNVATEEEATAIVDLALNNLRAYFAEIGEFTGTADPAKTAEAQNYYCHNQQQNPHTPRTMKSLGLNEADVDKFCTDMLFPKLA